MSDLRPPSPTAVPGNPPDPPPERPILVVSWVRHHGRSEGLARLLGGEALFMPWAKPRRGWAQAVLSWLRSAATTWRAVRRLPPGSIVVTMGPPPFAPMTVALAARRRRLKLVLDAHSGLFNDRRWLWAHRLLSPTLRRHDLVLVTNEELIASMPATSAPVQVLHDPLERRPTTPARQPSPTPYAVFPASGSADEPFDVLERAAELLAARGVAVKVTGDIGRSFSALEATGFLDDERYREVMRGAAAVLALTTREATMQRAAYEALELGRPIVASGTATLRQALDGAAIFVTADADDIARGVTEAIQQETALVAAGVEVVERMTTEAAAVADQIRSL